MFKGKNASRAIRQGAYAQGLKKIGYYEVISNYRMLNYDDPDYDRVVIRAYSPNGKKVVDITAEDIYVFETEYQEAPMARV